MSAYNIFSPFSGGSLVPAIIPDMLVVYIIWSYIVCKLKLYIINASLNNKTYLT